MILEKLATPARRKCDTPLPHMERVCIYVLLPQRWAWDYDLMAILPPEASVRINRGARLHS
jgi:hypothetical protein